MLTQYQQLDQEICDALSVLIQRVKISSSAQQSACTTDSSRDFRQQPPLLIIFFESFEFERAGTTDSAGSPHGLLENRLIVEFVPLKTTGIPMLFTKCRKNSACSPLPPVFARWRFCSSSINKAPMKRAGHLLHLLQRIIDISMPVALVVVLVS
jgi:hypothetical protein